MIRLGDFAVGIDLSDAYLHLAVHPQFRRYLRFQWENKTYQFKTGTFGLSIMPFYFNKVCRPILRWAQGLGIQVTAYLDDWLVLRATRQEASRHSTLILNKLHDLGWLVNWKKSTLTPSQTIQHLGYVLDT